MVFMNSTASSMVQEGALSEAGFRIDSGFHKNYLVKPKIQSEGKIYHGLNRHMTMDDVIQFASDLYLIPLDQEIPGFTDFIGSWLYKGDRTLLVDIGPAATVPNLVQALEDLGVHTVDAVLLTHIHIDHAGGIGDFISHFPGTPVVCHATGIPHLKDPTRVWEGSLKTLGDMARAYGPIRGVPEDLLQDAAQFREFGVSPILTPGHAPHHVSYRVEDFLFAGEAGGVYMALPDDGVHLRPATPPRFYLKTSVQSLKSLLDIPHKLLCYAHFGATQRSPEMLEAHMHQLFRWAELIEAQIQRDSGPHVVEHCMEALLKKDPLLAGWPHMKGAVRDRERYFFHNSIKGFIGYLSNKAEKNKGKS